MKKLFILLMVSGCCQQEPIPFEKLEQQPPELFLPPNTIIATTQGVYKSGNFTEIWHSHKKYSNLQDELSKFRPLTPSK